MIEVALNGVTSRRRNPNVPATVEEHAVDALACIDAGATIIHTHAPNLVVGADEAAEQYATTFRTIVEQHPGIICYPTVGFGDTVADRYRHVELLDDMGLVRQGAVDTGSVNLGGTGPDGLPPASEFVYSNPFAKIVLAHLMAQQTRSDPAGRHVGKVRLVRGLYERGLSAKDVRALFRVIDWIMDLPPELEVVFWEDIAAIEKEKQMPFITTPERVGRRAGIRKGIESLLRVRFGDEGLKLMPEIQNIHEEEKLIAILTELVSAKSPDEVRRIWLPEIG